MRGNFRLVTWSRCVTKARSSNDKECSPQEALKNPLPSIGLPDAQTSSGTQGPSIILQMVAAEALQKARTLATSSKSSEFLPLESLQIAPGSEEEISSPGDNEYMEHGEEDVKEKIDEDETEEDKRSIVQQTSHQIRLKLLQWMGKKKRISARTAEHHAKVHYGLKIETKTHDPKAARKRFADVFRKTIRGGSLDEGRRLIIHQQESGYSSPNVSAQHTPTTTHRLGSNPSFMRRSLELSPQKPPVIVRPRMSLPADHIRRTLDGRFSTQAIERRRRLSRGKTICQDDGFPLPAVNAMTESSGDKSNTSSFSQPASSKTTVVSSRRMSRPGSSSREESTGEESGFEEEEPIEIRVPPLVVEERRDSNSSNPQPRDTSDLQPEWAIAYDQLQFGNILRRGSTTNIYRGRWHGDVMIHTFHGSDEANQKRFWELVSSLKMIRHENIVLFMGACTTTPNLAIVTGVKRGMSLHYHQIVRGSLPYPSKVNVARQMAQAMSYLHSRGIIHGRLNSRNVFLEAKIKLSLLDHSMAESVPSAVDTGSLAQGLLTYYPPEMMRELLVSPPLIKVDFSPTQQTDVFMYGTLLYELFVETPPFEGQSPHSVIFQIGKGFLPSVLHLQCDQAFKDIIQECWHSIPAQRPVFPDMLQILQKPMALHRTHSTSEPERLNRIGISGRITC